MRRRPVTRCRPFRVSESLRRDAVHDRLANLQIVKLALYFLKPLFDDHAQFLPSTYLQVEKLEEQAPADFDDLAGDVAHLR